MYKQIICFLIFYSVTSIAFSQENISKIRFRSDVSVTIDRPVIFKKHKNTQIIFFALPNGNTTAQTMGKKMQDGDDWHFDIQHIKAQTAFIRDQLSDNIIVVYAENDLKAWPQWKRSHADYKEQIQSIIDTALRIINVKKYTLHLNGHSGGGSFIFGYLDGVQKIPSVINRITFLDSDYGYDSSYTEKFSFWLKDNKKARLTVFAYNDSVVVYNGKPLVSPTGGTWYRSKLMMKDLSSFQFSCNEDSIIHCSSADKRINFYLKQNPEAKIFHTQQVELNGFIHSVLIGTSKESGGYQYFGPRAYSAYIK